MESETDRIIIPPPHLLSPLSTWLQSSVSICQPVGQCVNLLSICCLSVYVCFSGDPGIFPQRLTVRWDPLIGCCPFGADSGWTYTPTGQKMSDVRLLFIRANLDVCPEVRLYWMNGDRLTAREVEQRWWSTHVMLECVQ